jgi:hypothetical protein
MGSKRTVNPRAFAWRMILRPVIADVPATHGSPAAHTDEQLTSTAGAQ